MPCRTVPMKSALLMGISSIRYIQPTRDLPDDTSPKQNRIRIIRYMLLQIMSSVKSIEFARHTRMKKLLRPNLSAYLGSQYMQHHPMKKADAMKPTFHPG